MTLLYTIKLSDDKKSLLVETPSILIDYASLVQPTAVKIKDQEKGEPKYRIRGLLKQSKSKNFLKDIWDSCKLLVNNKTQFHERFLPKNCNRDFIVQDFLKLGNEVKELKKLD